MDVSVIIVNYNTFKLTSDCIASVIKKTGGISYEIILVDNASSECDADLFRSKFPGIQLIVSKENLGFARGVNLAIKKAKGDILLLLNSDTELINNAIKIAFDRLMKDHKIGVLTGKLRYADGKIQAVANRFPTIGRNLRELFRINKFLSKDERIDYYLGEEFDHTCEKEADWIWGAFFMFSKEVLCKFPNEQLPADFFMYNEDMQWCYEIKKMGYRIIYSPEPELYHYIGGSDNSGFELQEKYFKVLLPKQFKLFILLKGKVYASVLFMLSALIHFSLLNKKDYQKGLLILKAIKY
jgi:GT2 family glycosyltransferase